MHVWVHTYLGSLPVSMVHGYRDRRSAVDVAVDIEEASECEGFVSLGDMPHRPGKHPAVSPAYVRVVDFKCVPR